MTKRKLFFLSFAEKKGLPRRRKGTNLPAGRQGRKMLRIFLCAFET